MPAADTPPRRCHLCGGWHWWRERGCRWRCWACDPGPDDWQRRPDIEVAHGRP
jgi:hypothetical protein